MFYSPNGFVLPEGTARVHVESATIVRTYNERILGQCVLDGALYATTSSRRRGDYP